MRISRNLDDMTPEQPTYDEQIEKVNEMLEEYGEKLDRDEIPMWLTNLIIAVATKLTKGDENFMEQFIAEGLKAIQKTELDDKLYEILADVMKEKIPGDQYEPIIGEAMIGIGEELQKPVE